MILQNNVVMILPDKNYTQDGEIKLSDVFEPARHWAIKGKVVAVPEKLICFRERIAELKETQKGARDPIVQQEIQELMRHSLEFDTEMEVQVGDEVMFRYMNRLSAVEDGEVLGRDILGEQGVIMVSYDELYLIKRGEDVIMLNGWILVEPIQYTKEELIELGGGFKKFVKTDEKPGVGIVRVKGTPNKGYVEGIEEGPDVEVGSEILFRHSLAVPIEYKYHKELNEGKHAFYRMQRKDILAYR